MHLFQMSLQAGVLILFIVILRLTAFPRIPKLAFPILWCVVVVRMLLPFSISSPYSIYTLIQTNESLSPASPSQVVPAVNIVPDAANSLKSDIPSLDQLTLFELVWLSGAVIAIIFYAFIYWKNSRELRFSLCIRDNDFINDWLKNHKLLRPITVYQSDRLTTPIMTGYFRPRIILPKIMNLEDKQLLDFVLTHEYCHIRRFDAFYKLIFTMALCLHWFNPLIYLMAILANRDLEITCDEMVLRKFGTDLKKTYAYSLLKIAEQRNRYVPFYSGFSKNATEERITAIMKYKKKTLVSIAAAFVILTSLVIVLITTPKSTSVKELMNIIPGKYASVNGTSAIPSLDISEFCYFVLEEDNKFYFFLDLVSSNIPRGTYVIKDDQLILKASGMERYNFKIEKDQLVFQSEDSLSPSKYLADGEIFQFAK